jgi:hypothetical protein
MYKKLVGILVMMLLFTTAISAVGTINDKENPINTGLVNNPKIQSDENEVKITEYPGYLFMQLPKMPWEFNPIGWTSDASSGFWAYEDFWDISSPICDIHWWGKCQKWISGQWHNRKPDGMVFNISFYEDNNGLPGDLVCYYEDVTPEITYTGIYYILDYPTTPFPMPLYFFEYDLDPCCDISTGWVCVKSTYVPSGGWFMWFESWYGNHRFYQNIEGMKPIDLAYILTDREDNPVPDLECEGELRWEEVKPGTNVTGSVKIRNNGDTGSILHCKIDESTIPNWGNWTFEANATILTVDVGWITGNVTVTAPEDKNKEFTGKIKVINAQDSTDYCEIDIYLKTPRTRTKYNNLLLQLFERFPILRHLIGLI